VDALRERLVEVNTRRQTIESPTQLEVSACGPGYRYGGAGSFNANEYYSQITGAGIGPFSLREKTDAGVLAIPAFCR
jgi:hypothetical protein